MTDSAWSPSTDRTRPPIDAVPILVEVDAALLELLPSLDEGAWRQPTIAGAWTVRDVTAHLLDTALRRLSFARDGWMPATTVRTEKDFVALINRANAEGVQALGRLSPRVLIALMERACEDLHAYLGSLDPHGPAAFAVSWAGESSSENWFDIARELTERWHHQAQIRLALGKPGLVTPRAYHAVLDCFLRALPHRFRDVPAADAAQLEVVIDGSSGGRWAIARTAAGWRPIAAADPARVAARVTIPDDIAWRVFTKGIDPRDTERRSTIDGDATLAAPVLGLTAIVG
jgi:uncharacterized protein (TIGR03083 family)